MEKIETKEWVFEEIKKELPYGPWMAEPDKIQWTDKATGLPCLIVRHYEMGNLCGYVGIGEDHPFFEKEYSDCSLGEAKPRGPSDFDNRKLFGKTPPKFMVENHQKQLICSEEYCEHQPESILWAHGGITFSGHCQENNKERGICHVGEEKVYWFGFDCGHGDDIIPSFLKLYDQLGITSFTGKYGESYKDIAYVKRECRKLAKQLAGVK